MICILKCRRLKYSLLTLPYKQVCQLLVLPQRNTWLQAVRIVFDFFSYSLISPLLDYMETLPLRWGDENLGLGVCGLWAIWGLFRVTPVVIRGLSDFGHIHRATHMLLTCKHLIQPGSLTGQGESSEKELMTKTHTQKKKPQTNSRKTRQRITGVQRI